MLSTMKASACGTVAVLSVLGLPVFAAETYVAANVAADGQLRITTAAGKTIQPKKEREQVAFAQPLVSPDGTSVGWLAEFPNCCTSYPIALKLMVLTNGRLRSFTGIGLAFSKWGFQAKGTQFAFRQETVHGGLGIHYELHDITTGRLLAEYEPPVGADNRPISPQNIPRWVSELTETPH